MFFTRLEIIYFQFWEFKKLSLGCNYLRNKLKNIMKKLICIKLLIFQKAEKKVNLKVLAYIKIFINKLFQIIRIIILEKKTQLLSIKKIAITYKVFHKKI